MHTDAKFAAYCPRRRPVGAVEFKPTESIHTAETLPKFTLLKETMGRVTQSIRWFWISDQGGKVRRRNGDRLERSSRGSMEGCLSGALTRLFLFLPLSLALLLFIALLTRALSLLGSITGAPLARIGRIGKRISSMAYRPRFAMNALINIAHKGGRHDTYRLDKRARAESAKRRPDLARKAIAKRARLRSGR